MKITNSHKIKHHEKQLNGSGYEDIGFEITTGEPIGIYSKVLIFPFDINIFSGQFVDDIEHKGNIVNMTILPDNLTVGYSLSDAEIGSNNVVASSTVIDIVKIGYYYSITNGVNSQDLGKVIDFNKNTGEVYFQNNFIYPFGVGSYLKQTIPFVTNKKLHGIPSYIDISGSSQSSFLPANTPIYIYLEDNSIGAKVFNFSLEIFQ